MSLWRTASLGVILAFAALWDLRSRRIPNVLTLPGILLGVAFLAWETGWAGVWTGFAGALAGAGLLFLPFALGGLGAGDVKLMAVVGAFGGPALAFRAFLGAALAGGLASAVALARAGRLGSTLRIALWDCLALVAPAVPFVPLPRRPDGEPEGESRGESEEKAGAGIPYGVAIALGTVASWFWRVR